MFLFATKQFCMILGGFDVRSDQAVELYFPKPDLPRRQTFFILAIFLYHMTSLASCSALQLSHSWTCYVDCKRMGYGFKLIDLCCKLHLGSIGCLS